MNEKLVSKLETIRDEIQSLINMLSGELPEVFKSPEKVAPQPIQATVEHLSEFEQLKSLLLSEDWCRAVNPYLICDLNSPEDRAERADGVLDLLVDTNVEGKRILDFGCGGGDVALSASRRNADMAVGYDINQVWDHDNTANLVYTTDWMEVKNHGPYNFIIAYDVLDHLEKETAQQVLPKIKSVLHPKGKFIVRCHPWSSRHATHLYRTLNKAFVHLVFDQEELRSMGYEDIIPIEKVIHPLSTYRKWFGDAGFTVVTENIIKEPVESFFMTHPVIANRIKVNWLSSHEEDLRTGKRFPSWQMEQQFIDYTLSAERL